MHKGKKIILVDDEKEYRLEISKYLATQGFFVYATESINEFKDCLDKQAPDIALIDKNLGFDNGFDLIHYIRKHDVVKNIPIIVVTGESELNSRLKAFKLGADDLLVKPVALEELEERVRANLRRSGSYQIEEQTIDYENIHINLRSHEVYIGEQKIPLTNIEYKIFLELISRKNEIIRRERIVSRILSVQNSSPRTLDVHMNSLRKKLGEESRKIKTVRGRGYVFRVV